MDAYPQKRQFLDIQDFMFEKYGRRLFNFFFFLAAFVLILGKNKKIFKFVYRAFSLSPNI